MTNADRRAGLPAATGIVLAGGRSVRFGRDKLAEPVGGRPLVHRPIRALAPLVREVVVVSGSPVRIALPEAGDLGVPLRVVSDEKPGLGPLVGLLAGLERAGEPLVVAVGGDMPALVPEVLRTMLVALSAAGADADACVLEARGRAEPLPIALRTGAGTDAVRSLVAAGERRLDAIRDVLRVRVLGEWEWRALDPDTNTLRDIDVPADLAGLQDGGTSRD